MTTANPNLFCECPDDRCAGFHHAVGDPCGCYMLPLACAVCGHETDAHPRAGACDLCPADACQPIGAPADAVASTPGGLADAVAGALRFAESVEAACEEALAGGRCGVAVVEGVPIVDPSVPYGALWEFPTRAAYRARCGQLGGAS